MIRWPCGSPSCWRVRSWSSSPSRSSPRTGAGDLGEPLRERDQRLLRVPQPRRLVARVVERGMASRVVAESGHTRLQHDREALADADADRRDAVLPAVGLERVGERAEDAPAGRAERVADGDRAAVDVHALGVEVLPLAHAGERLRGERLVELDGVDVAPADAGALERPVGRLDRADAEDVGVDGERAAAGDPGDRLAARLARRPPRSRSARADAPSLSGDALPAVTVPSLTNAGLSLASFSSDRVGADALVAGELGARRPGSTQSS